MNNPCKKLPGLLAALFSLSLTLFLPNITNAADTAKAKGNPEAGAKIFKQNCAVCHSLGTAKVTGPGLEGVTSRVPQPYAEWMHKWIKNNVALQKTDAYAKKIFADNSNTAMTVFDGTITDAQIDDVIAFLANPPKDEEAKGPSGSSGVTGNSAGDHGTSGIGVILLLIIAALTIIILVLRSVKKSLHVVLSTKKGLPTPPDFTLWQETKHWMRTHKLAVACINIFLTAVFCVYGWEYLWGIDVTPGYHPSQPINFSHQVHAGTNSIACIYCHSGAEKGKVAGIPTLNVCMNCHKGIQGSNAEYKSEISKIYYAAGWDPSKGEYSNPTHPVIWNRVHSLPDFAYFNHAQHVVAGKVECQKCHGPVETYVTDKQFAPLTMGWCVNCHRETPVHMDSNGYYEKLHQALKLKFPDKVITEADMGGLECGKCHY
jgi:mono/diheme cytochrome c family protein